MSDSKPGRPPMTPQPEEPMPDERGPVPPMGNPNSPPRPTPTDTHVPDPDDPIDNEDKGVEQPPARDPFPDHLPNP